jgi:hypothetical protein
MTNLRLLPGDPRELVQLDLVFHDETWMLSDPVPRHIAQDTLRVFAEQALPVNGKRVIQALIVPVMP